jgi:hypothetical protein
MGSRACCRICLYGIKAPPAAALAGFAGPLRLAPSASGAGRGRQAEASPRLLLAVHTRAAPVRSARS